MGAASGLDFIHSLIHKHLGDIKIQQVAFLRLLMKLFWRFYENFDGHQEIFCVTNRIVELSFSISIIISLGLNEKLWNITFLKTLLRVWKTTWNNLYCLVGNCCYFVPGKNSSRKVPAGNYMFKVNNRNTRTRLKYVQKITKRPEQHHWRCSGVFIVNSEHISHLALVFLLLSLSR